MIIENFNDKALNSLHFSFETFADDEINKRLESQQALVSQLCKFYQKGTCMKGASCTFRHTKGIKREVCKHWLRSLCKKGDYCEYLHEYDMLKMSPCRFFTNFGRCNNPDCYFQHVNPSDKITDCPWYDRGFCKHGANCKHRHTRKTACPNYMGGFCPNGKECPLAHPKYELAMIDDRTRLSGKSVEVMICSRCGSMGHKAQLCPIAPSSDNVKRPGLRDVSEVTCFKCGQKGHYANVCINKRVAPPTGGYSIPAKRY